MVVFFEWHRTALDPKSCCCLPMTGEDTGLGASASPLAGYLEKVQARATSLENCPWCTSKGLTYALRSYRINLQESITLCTNPQCLFPLVTRPLDDVLASLVPVEPVVGTKRKNLSSLEEELTPSIKRLRSSELDDLGVQSDLDAPTSRGKNDAQISLTNSQHGAPQTDCEKVNGFQRGFVASGAAGWEMVQEKEGPREDQSNDAPLTCPDSVVDSSEILVNTEVVEVAPSPHLVPLGMLEINLKQEKSPPEDHEQCNSHQSTFPSEDIHSPVISIPSSLYEEQTMMAEQQSLPTDINICKDLRGPKSESVELISVPNQLFWPNSDNLCWLDSLLVALVNCRSLRKCQPQDEPQKSTVWRLMREYEDICAAVRAHQQTGEDGVVRVSNHLLQKANEDLQSLRMSMFKMLKPKLQCKLGQQETPVFAMPLLLEMDSWAEMVFKSWFYWDFQCNSCKAATQVGVMKTLPTLTNLVPGWRPLDAVHKAPCNVCRSKNQQRTVVLERVPSVLALHFVEGLPDSDISLYAFDFKGQRRSITTVIQFCHKRKHFVTWTRNSDGSWLEYDDLKHPHCTTHQTLGVPAEEMHVVFWEVEEEIESHAVSPSSTLAESSLSETKKIPTSNDKDSTTDNPVVVSADETLPHNDTDIIDALLVSDSSLVTDTSAVEETSIGANTLLDTFEGLTHNDIVTLTLVEVKPDSQLQPLDVDQQTQDPIHNEVINIIPDRSFSSTAAVDRETCHSSEVELPPTPSSPEPEPVDNPSSDGRKRRRNTKGKTASKKRGKKASKKAPSTKKAPPSKSSEVIIAPPSCPAPQDIVIPVELPQQGAPLSSTNTTPLCTNLTSSSASVTDAGLSYLLSKHRVIQKPSAAPRAAPSTHSTPFPVRRLPFPPAFHSKVPLRTEEGDGLPLIAAERYGAFSTMRSNHLANATAMSAPSPMALVGNPLHDRSSLNRQSSKLPAGLTSTDALRHKLLKKLKAKKKKLAKLNMLIGDQRCGASLRPDSTDLGSPSTVTSSTYDEYDDILSDLLSPATTASNLSPDSTEFLERLTTGQNGTDTAALAPQNNGSMNTPKSENFLDDFLLQAEAQRPTEMESEALSALELFM